MPRKPRQEVAGGVFHVFSRGVDRRRIFLDDLDRELYLALLGGVTRRQGWWCLAYCLMDNHFHMLVQTPEPNLGAGMRRLNGTYAQAFNERYARSGHLFENRFNDRGVASARSVVAVATYIAANPVEAGACRAPEDWPWSSHSAQVAGTAPPWLASDRLHDLLAAEGDDATGRYLEALAERVAAAGDAAPPDVAAAGEAAPPDATAGTRRAAQDARATAGSATAGNATAGSATPAEVAAVRLAA